MGKRARIIPQRQPEELLGSLLLGRKFLIWQSCKHDTKQTLLANVCQNKSVVRRYADLFSGEFSGKKTRIRKKDFKISLVSSESDRT